VLLLGHAKGQPGGAEAEVAIQPGGVLLQYRQRPQQLHSVRHMEHLRAGRRGVGGGVGSRGTWQEGAAKAAGSWEGRGSPSSGAAVMDWIEGQTSQQGSKPPPASMLPGRRAA
jgi:hypothetical protein